MTDHGYRFRQELLEPLRREADRRLLVECAFALARAVGAVGLLLALAAVGAVVLGLGGAG